MDDNHTKNNLPPPLSTTNEKLPFHRLDCYTFETVCRDLIAAHFNAPGDIKNYGTKGQKQEGIDIIWIKEEYTVYQVKQYKNFTPSDLKSAINEFSKGKFFTKARAFNICISHPVVEKKLVDEIDSQKQILQSQNICLKIYDSNDLHSWAVEYPHIIQEYFGSDYYRCFVTSNHLQPEKFTPINYSKVKNYIPMLIEKYPIQESQDWLILNEKLGFTLAEVVVNVNRVALLAGAGYGKTKQLENLAYELSTNGGDYYPLFISLNMYRGQTIKELVLEHFNLYDFSSLPIEKLVLIFDGFDELTEIDNAKINFVKCINQFTESYPNTKIVISSRANSYLNCYDNNMEKPTGIIKNFSLYEIITLSNTNLQKYVGIHLGSLKSENFIKEIQKNQLSSLIKIPFYLTKLVEMFKKENALPKRATLIDDIIRYRFISDGEKRSLDELSTQSNEVVQSLERIAFELQSKATNFFNNQEYQSFCSEKERKLLKSNGTWCLHSNNVWQFEHNILQEYLTAKSLSRLSFDNILNKVTYLENNKPRIWSHFLNPLVFLLDLNGEIDITEWIINNAPEVAIRSDSEAFEPQMRFTIFKRTIDNLEARGTWFNRNYFTERELVRFGKSEEALNHVLSKLTKKNLLDYNKRRILLICIDLVKYFDTYLKICRKEIIKALFDILLDTQDNYIKSQVIESLADSGVSRPSETSTLFSMFSQSEDEKIIKSLQYYIYKLDLQNENDYADWLLESLIKTNPVGSYYVCLGLKNITKFEPLTKVLKFLSTYNPHSHRVDEIFDYACKNATQLYESDKHIFDAVFDSYALATELEVTYFTQNRTRSMNEFFVATQTVDEFLDKVLIIDNPEILPHITPIIDNNALALEKLENLYISGNAGNIFIEFLDTMNPSDLNYSKFLNLATKNNGYQEINKQMASIERRALDQQKYFDALFIQEDFTNLIRKFLTDYNLFEKSMCELTSYENDEIKEILLSILRSGECNYEIYRFLAKFSVSTSKKLSEVLSELKHVNCQNFLMAEVYRLLSNQQDYPKIAINTLQLESIHNWVQESIEKIDFNNTFDYKNRDSKPHDIEVAFLLIRFDIQCKDEVLLDLLMFDPDIFINSLKISIPTYVSNKINDSDSITKRIKYNIDNRFLADEAYRTHINYCYSNKLDFAIEIALSDCHNTNSLTKDISLKYLMLFLDQNDIITKVMPSADNDLLFLISDEYLDKRDKRISDEIERRYIEEEEKPSLSSRFLIHLIKMNREFGLNELINIFRNRVNSLNIDGMYPVIEAIKHINQISLLPQLRELFDILFSDNFSDSSSFGLSCYLSKSYIGVAAQGKNKSKVIEELQHNLNQYSPNEKVKYFCNSTLDEIERIACPDEGTGNYLTPHP